MHWALLVLVLPFGRAHTPHITPHTPPKQASLDDSQAGWRWLSVPNADVWHSPFGEARRLRFEQLPQIEVWGLCDSATAVAKPAAARSRSAAAVAEPAGAHSKSAAAVAEPAAAVAEPAAAQPSP